MSKSDTLATAKGPVVLSFIGHGSLMIQFGPLVTYIDPVSEFGDYSSLPKADLILVTHAHYDHLDPKAIRQISQPATQIIAAPVCREKAPTATFLRNGEKIPVGDLEIEAVPAYNILHKRPDQQPFHPKGEGNGYILRFGGKSIYIAGDTENTPEMKGLKSIDVAFLPMNLPYTMTPEMVADAARAFQPHILYPYHYGDTDTRKLTDLLRGEKIEVRIHELH
ncbi:MAG TPA: MBL fold metallo-hydrolase [bacterium]|nr:MBL fold metallo-hydrolase [bacterium]HQG44235.1 MBL fold metallo-hydrolase [bacterium]HQJ63604.1 MBL fold metallo-hydrolase [bacterium]